jgi:hypothetical protein
VLKYLTGCANRRKLGKLRQAGKFTMSVQRSSGVKPFLAICRWALVAVTAQLTINPALATGCLPLMERAPPLELSYFADDTSHVLEYAQSDDNKLENKLTVYLATDPELVTSLKGLLVKTPATRHYVIGKALGRAALHCGGVEPAYTRKIMTFVNALRDSDVMAGYMSIETTTGAALGTIAKAGSAGAGPKALFDGEFGTELANPFDTPSVPQ